jgi:hypothetical protein
MRARMQKTKDKNMSTFKTLSSHYFSDMIAQCDEARPSCRSCLKVKAACEYEFPAGQTRNQALAEKQCRLQGQLRTIASLIHACAAWMQTLRVEFYAIYDMGIMMESCYVTIPVLI